MLSENEMREILKEFTILKGGLQALTSEDCPILSQKIFDQTKNYVSATTLRKFFGFLESTGKPSPFVLNSLSGFVGFSNYEAFTKSFEHPKLK